MPTFDPCPIRVPTVASRSARVCGAKSRSSPPLSPPHGEAIGVRAGGREGLESVCASQEGINPRTPPIQEIDFFEAATQSIRWR
jgi:hypothetical protein